MYTKQKLIFFFLFISLYTSAQNFFFKIQNNIPFKTDKTLTNAWAAGLNSPQFSTMDLNFDNVQDLVIYERTASKILTFLGNGANKTYEYAPEYEVLFPQNIVGWLLLRDYNQDGKKDIFAKSSLGIQVYKNVSSESEGIKWELITSAITSEGFSGQINLQVPITDIPALVDLDDDNDMDILVFDIAGGFIEFHQNQSQERYGNSEELEYTKTSTCWGGIQELANCGDFNFGISCLLQNDFTEKGNDFDLEEVFHVGSSLLILDIDGDGAKDALIGDVSCTPAYTFYNQGSNISALFTNANTDFPNSKPINFQLFPAVFWEDVNFDGVKDLLSSPNTFSNEADLMNFQESVWFYENTGTDINPNFQYQKDDFLQEDILDLGENVSPTFVDFDADGDLDLFVGNRGNTESDGFYGKLFYFENIGTQENPNFELKNDDFLNISTQKWTEIRPSFRDVNGDNAVDLLITVNDLIETKLYFVPNLAPINQAFSFDLNNLQNINLPISLNDFPLLLDTDQDNDLDLLVGKSQGNLVYYQNIGNDASPNYQLITESLGNIRRSTSKRALTLSIADIDGDSNLDLLTGDRSGFLNIYSDFLNRLEEDWVSESKIVFNEIENNYLTYKFGTAIFPSLADLNADNVPEIIVGTNMGGFYHLENQGEGINLPNPNGNEIILAPNPIAPQDTSNRFIYISLKEDSEIQIFDTKGKSMSPKQKVEGNKVTPILVDYLASGMYILHIENSSGTQNKRFVIAK